MILGNVSEIQKKISLIFTNTDWSDPAWGTWSSPDGSVEFNIGSEEQIDSIALHVRANKSVVPMIVQLALQNGWQALDGSTESFSERSDNPTKGFQEWCRFRDETVNESS